MAKRPVKIANVSGATGDGPRALYNIVRGGPVDVVTGDYLAEVNLAWLALEKKKDPAKGYEGSFLRQLDRDTAHIIADKRIKVVHDGGALNPKGLADAIRAQLQAYGITSLTVAYVEGDDLTAQLPALQQPGATPHLDEPGRFLADLAPQPVLSANAYVGMGGIVAALAAGADIVVSGRCCDASPVMGAAAWWHGWAATDYDALGGALLAGHCIECGCYATGGNFSGFKAIPHNWDQGFPVADIAADGTFDISIQDGAHGLVSRDTITAQLVYEIQGPLYLNPDVVADISDVAITPKGKNRVAVSGIRGQPPPPTTKLAVCTDGGFQIEFYAFATGLDIAGKLADFRALLDDKVANRADYRVLRIDQYGAPQPDAPSQALATCLFRVFAQADAAATLATLPPVIGGYGLGGFCGQHACMDFRMLAPRPFVRYEPFRVPYAAAALRVVVGDAPAAPVALPPTTQPFAGQPSSVDDTTAASIDLAAFGPTRRAPLGARIHARSGDKGANANVGFWALSDDEFTWLRGLLTVARFRALLGDDARAAARIERCELPHLRCVHFVVVGVLEGGISSSARLDGLAKSFGEFLRAREVDVPVAFLERGWI